MDATEIRLAENARFDRVGEYGTRPGYISLSDPIGLTQIADSSSGTVSFVSGDTVKPYTFTANADATLYSVQVYLKRAAGDSSYVVPQVNISVNGQQVSSSCLNPGQVSGSAIIGTVEFMDCPNISSGDEVTISLSAQSGSLSATEVRVNGSGELLCKVNSATAGAITNIFETNIDGDKSIFFVFNDVLYWRNSTGVVSSILGNSNLLNNLTNLIPGLTDLLTNDLELIQKSGMREAVKSVL